MQMQVCKHAFPPYVRSCAAPKPRAASKTRRPRVPQSVRRRKILQARRFQMRPTPGSPAFFPALLPIRCPASPACAPTQESAPCSTGQAPSRSCAVALAAGTAGSRRFPPYAPPRRSLPMLYGAGSVAQLRGSPGRRHCRKLYGADSAAQLRGSPGRRRCRLLYGAGSVAQLRGSPGRRHCRPA